MKERDSSIRIGIVWSSRNWWVGIINDSPGKSVLSTIVFIGSVQAVFLTIAFPNFGDTNPIVTSKPIVRSTNLWFYQSNLCSNNEKNPKKRRIISSRIHGGILWWRRSKSVWWERSEPRRINDTWAEKKKFFFSNLSELESCSHSHDFSCSVMRTENIWWSDES